MTALRYSLPLFASMFVGLACLTTPYPSMQIDAEATAAEDFSAYKRFAWADPNPPHENISKEVDAVVRREVEAALATKGITRTAPGKHDFWIHYDGFNRERAHKVPNFGAGGVYSHSKIDFEERHFTQGTLLLDFFDAQTNRMTWRGWATAVLHEDRDREDIIRVAVQRILDRFPPR